LGKQGIGRIKLQKLKTWKWAKIRESGNKDKNQIIDIIITIPNQEIYEELLELISNAMGSKYGIWNTLTRTTNRFSKCKEFITYFTYK
jgi:hypothetical protein